jgi:hypothetical protein
LRRLVALLAVLVVFPVVSAQAASGPRLSIGLSGLRVVYGHAQSLSGTLSSGQAGHRVGVYSEQFGKRRMRWVATVETRSGGHWSYRVRPSIRTAYEARTGSTMSGMVTVGVEPAVEVTQFADGRIVARVRAGHLFAGRKVELQRPRGTGWGTLETAVLGVRSEATFASPISAGSAMLRVAMSVNQAGAGYLGSRSDPFIYRARSVTLAPSAFKVLYGDSLVLSGRISPGESGQPVTILGLAYGHSAPSKLATVTTRAGGGWSFRAKPSIRTSYLARWVGNQSRRLVVGVEPRLSLSRLANGRILVHVAVARQLTGRKIELQQLTAAKKWRTLEELPLNRLANVTFPAPFATGSATLRVAMSVNQAGAGLLGSSSKAFLYHRT